MVEAPNKVLNTEQLVAWVNKVAKLLEVSVPTHLTEDVLQMRFNQDVTSALKSIQKELVTIKADIVNIKADIVNIKDDIVNIKDDIVNIKADIVSLKAEDQALWAAIAALTPPPEP